MIMHPRVYKMEVITFLISAKLKSLIIWKLLRDRRRILYKGWIKFTSQVEFCIRGWFKFMSEEEFCYRDGLRMIFFITGTF